ncbi:hypothetical protein SAICODRAFT_67952 [Saitoella complicata NRRL Y-17804]|uniref:Mannosyltransferase n=1 Tax=Saitoella complicata (strain BCRC 22490 / CBS 7301 / JCM 7358 / NBRC 10748 / NRRL Y-17804) TaxID=698492 RepID=A0A0E9NJ64_SAICN|nr:uncharacterized protein SAICODRAFT_67952 [Saitoella complicata NRRL Y-17804]ODQ50123.1 hypothetical protein SAICODRAFT_67952 [Saitoella complicata NRRL Y-17804]GAO49902.1 hypothetical protein G7K_4038-t1 [Saitoella complicata NRRL Y-17804]
MKACSGLSLFTSRQRKLYFFLLVIRVLFALFSPSYIHPDEHFQTVAPLTSRARYDEDQLTWEWTGEKPIRSVVLLWPIVGSIFRLTGNNTQLALLGLRMLWFIMSLGVDLAIPHLVAPGSAAIPLLLYASSYTTLTYQAHTFSNGIETILVVWSIVLCFRLRARPSATHSALLGLLAALGIWTRVTFPAFLLPAIVSLIPRFLCRSSLLAASGFAFSATAFGAILVDSAYFARDGCVITPLNNLMYNTSSANLALHGIHARYTHFVGNLPLLLGPALVLVFVKIRRLGLLFWCAMSGVAIVSIFPHQEPRFLLPAVPLILSSITSLPGRRFWRTWLATWVIFNTVLAILMGVLHQGGVVPTLLAAKQQLAVCPSGERTMVWWKTYTPPTWLLGSMPINTRDMAGTNWDDVKSVLDASAISFPGQKWCAKTLLIAPVSARRVLGGTYVLEQVLVSPWHIGLDDLDFEDGVAKELKRVLGGLGLGVWALVDAH